MHNKQTNSYNETTKLDNLCFTQQYIFTSYLSIQTQSAFWSDEV